MGHLLCKLGVTNFAGAFVFGRAIARVNENAPAVFGCLLICIRYYVQTRNCASLRKRPKFAA